eukprot:5168248-Prorocentrum_lima.AAC.1
MTSSLVGSEMCIRDSGYLVPLVGWQMSQSYHPGGHCLVCDSVSKKFNACLLYTSDAADDM